MWGRCSWRQHVGLHKHQKKKTVRSGRDGGEKSMRKKEVSSK